MPVLAWALHCTTTGMTTVSYVDDARSRRSLSSVRTESGFALITETDPVEALRRCKKPSLHLARRALTQGFTTGAEDQVL